MNNHVHKPPKPECRIHLDFSVSEARTLMMWINHPQAHVLPPQIVGETYDALFASVNKCDEYLR